MSQSPGPSLQSILARLCAILTILTLICPSNAAVCPLNNGQEFNFNGVRYRLSCSRYVPTWALAPYRDTPAILWDIDTCASSCAKDARCVSATAVWENLFFVRCRHYAENISSRFWILGTSASWIRVEQKAAVAPPPPPPPVQTKPYIPPSLIADASAKCAAATPTAPHPLFDEKGVWQCCRPIQTMDPATGEMDDVC